MDRKFQKFYVDWWNIRKTTIYGIAALVLFGLLIGGGGWWAYRSSWFVKTETAEIPPDAGRLISFEGDVRIIRAATRETILVTKQTYVSAGDTIQTQGDGRATVQMIDGSVLAVRPNSTVIIKDSSSIFGGTNVRVTLDDGQINVKTEEQPENTQNVVEVMESKNRLLAQTDASFNTNPATNGGEIRISRGGVESSVGSEKTIIKANEFAAVNNGTIVTKEKLLDSPKQDNPANSAQIISVDGSGADVTFRWQSPEKNSDLNYHLQLSKSPFFVADAMIIERDSLANTNFTLGNIAPGVYYWRTRAKAGSGQMSNWSEPWKFTIVKREVGAAIEASEWSVEQVGGNIYIIGGKTRSGLVVRSQGRETFASGDGSFRLQISSPSPEVTVEIRDEKGNRSGYVLSLRTAKATRRF
ncbi:MAG: FecR domain-containing protein [Pyrinomonadaceae bacterium]